MRGIFIVSVICLASCSPSHSDAPAYDSAWFRLHGDSPKDIDEKFGDSAQAACSVGADDYLRSIATHDFKWDDDATGVLGVKFDQFSTASTGQGMLTLVSNRAKLGNAFGGYEPVQIYCLYNAENGQVARYSRHDPVADLDDPDSPSSDDNRAD